jgi:hypothetical protein
MSEKINIQCPGVSSSETFNARETVYSASPHFNLERTQAVAD